MNKFIKYLNCKIFSKIINEKLKQQCEKFLFEDQHDFRKGCSCIDKAFCVKMFGKKERI